MALFVCTHRLSWPLYLSVCVYVRRVCKLPDTTSPRTLSFNSRLVACIHYQVQSYWLRHVLLHYVLLKQRKKLNFNSLLDLIDYTIVLLDLARANSITLSAITVFRRKPPKIFLSPYHRLLNYLIVLHKSLPNIKPIHTVSDYRFPTDNYKLCWTWDSYFSIPALARPEQPLAGKQC